MYEGVRVERDGYGGGVVDSDVKCACPWGETYLLFIQFDDRLDMVSMYVDEVEIKHDS
jgi:hypothetical protein